jgi:hypothetical protein
MSDSEENVVPSSDDASQDDDFFDPLEMLLEQEAHRVIAETELEPDPELVAQGWERRFMADARRVKEAIDLYTEMGYEIHTVPLQPVELADDCEGCRLVVAFQFQNIYTRKKTDQPPEDEEKA